MARPIILDVSSIGRAIISDNDAPQDFKDAFVIVQERGHDFHALDDTSMHLGARGNVRNLADGLYHTYIGVFRDVDGLFHTLPFAVQRSGGNCLIWIRTALQEMPDARITHFYAGHAHSTIPSDVEGATHVEETAEGFVYKHAHESDHHEYEYQILRPTVMGFFGLLLHRTIARFPADDPTHKYLEVFAFDVLQDAIRLHRALPLGHYAKNPDVNHTAKHLLDATKDTREDWVRLAEEAEAEGEPETNVYRARWAVLDEPSAEFVRELENPPDVMTPREHRIQEAATAARLQGDGS